MRLDTTTLGGNRNSGNIVVIKGFKIASDFLKLWCIRRANGMVAIAARNARKTLLPQRRASRG